MTPGIYLSRSQPQRLATHIVESHTRLSGARADHRIRQKVIPSLLGLNFRIRFEAVHYPKKFPIFNCKTPTTTNPTDTRSTSPNHTSHHVEPRGLSSAEPVRFIASRMPIALINLEQVQHQEPAHPHGAHSWRRPPTPPHQQEGQPSEVRRLRLCPPRRKFRINLGLEKEGRWRRAG